MDPSGISMQQFQIYGNIDSTAAVTDDFEPGPPTDNSATVKNVLSALIEENLSKLFECLKVEYGKHVLVSPKWKKFGSQQLNFSEKTRLNNAIWRCWHLQFQKGRKPVFCQFVSPLSEEREPPKNPLAVILEGRYWRRKLDAVAREYKRWRTYYKNKTVELQEAERERARTLSTASSGDEITSKGSPMAQVMDIMDTHLTTDAVLSSHPDTLFTARSRLLAPATIEQSAQRQAVRGVIYQPKLDSLQPNLDEFVEHISSLADLIAQQEGSLGPGMAIPPGPTSNVGMSFQQQLMDMQDVIYPIQNSGQGTQASATPLQGQEYMDTSDNYVQYSVQYQNFGGALNQQLPQPPPQTIPELPEVTSQEMCASGNQRAMQQSTALTSPVSPPQLPQSPLGVVSPSGMQQSSAMLSPAAAMEAQQFIGGSDPTQGNQPFAPSNVGSMAYGNQLQKGRLPRNVSDSQLYHMENYNSLKGLSLLPAYEAQLPAQVQFPNLVAQLQSIQGKRPEVQTIAAKQPKRARLPRNMSDSRLDHMGRGSRSPYAQINLSSGSDANMTPLEQIRAQAQAQGQMHVVSPPPKFTQHASQAKHPGYKSRKGKMPRNMSDSSLMHMSQHHIHTPPSWLPPRPRKMSDPSIHVMGSQGMTSMQQMPTSPQMMGSQGMSSTQQMPTSLQMMGSQAMTSTQQMPTSPQMMVSQAMTSVQQMPTSSQMMGSQGMSSVQQMPTSLQMMGSQGLTSTQQMATSPQMMVSQAMTSVQQMPTSPQMMGSQGITSAQQMPTSPQMMPAEASPVSPEVVLTVPVSIQTTEAMPQQTILEQLNQLSSQSVMPSGATGVANQGQGSPSATSILTQLLMQNNSQVGPQVAGSSDDGTQMMRQLVQLVQRQKQQQQEQQQQQSNLPRQQNSELLAMLKAATQGQQASELVSLLQASTQQGNTTQSSVQVNPQLVQQQDQHLQQQLQQQQLHQQLLQQQQQQQQLQKQTQQAQQQSSQLMNALQSTAHALHLQMTQPGKTQPQLQHQGTSAPVVQMANLGIQTTASQPVPILPYTEPIAIAPRPQASNTPIHSSYSTMQQSPPAMSTVTSALNNLQHMLEGASVRQMVLPKGMKISMDAASANIQQGQSTASSGQTSEKLLLPSVSSTVSVADLLKATGSPIMSTSASSTATQSTTSVRSTHSTAPAATRPHRPVSTADREQYKEHRRMSHISAEQKRRCNIKMGFDQLASMVPSLAHQKNSKVSKATVLQKTVDYTTKLQRERETMANEEAVLRREIQDLNSSINACQAQLPATGAPVNRPRADRMSMLFNDHVKTRTEENFIFWIFSVLIRQLFESYNNTVSTLSAEEFCRTVLAWQDQHCTLPALRPAVLSALRDLSRTTSILTDPSRLPDEARRGANADNPTNVSDSGASASRGAVGQNFFGGGIR